MTFIPNPYGHRGPATPWAQESFEIDDATGLPKTPDNHYWDVQESDETYLKVYLRKKETKQVKRLFVGLTKVETIVTLGETPIDKAQCTPEKLAEKCIWILHSIQRDLYRKSNEWRWKTYIGQYPPKNANTVEDGATSA